MSVTAIPEGLAPGSADELDITDWPSWGGEPPGGALPGAGSGGTGWWTDGHGGGGGGDDDGEWDDEPWPRRRHPPAVKAVALVTAGLLLLGTAGAWVSVALQGDDTGLAVTVSVPAGALGGTGTLGREMVQLNVTNRTGTALPVTCVVETGADGRVAVTPVSVGDLASGTAAVVQVPARLAQQGVGLLPAAAACS